MTYETLARFAQQAGSVYFVLMFVVGFAYALWPANRGKFDHAKRALLQDPEEPQ